MTSLTFSGVAQSQHLHPLRAKAASSHLKTTRHRTVHLRLAATLPNGSTFSINNNLPIPVDLVPNEAVSKLGGGSNPSTLLLSPYLTATTTARLSELKMDAYIVPSLTIPKITRIELSYDFQSLLFLTTFTKDWIHEQLNDVVVWTKTANSESIPLVTLDGVAVNVDIIKVETQERGQYGIITRDTILVLPSMTKVRELQAGRCWFSHTVFGQTGVRLKTLFEMLKFDFFDGVYGALIEGATGTGKTALIHGLCKETGIEPHTVSFARLLTLPSKLQGKELTNILDRAISSEKSLVILDKLNLLLPKSTNVPKSDIHKILIQFLNRLSSHKGRILLLGVTSNGESTNLTHISHLLAERITLPTQLAPNGRILALETLLQQDGSLSVSSDVSVSNLMSESGGFTIADVCAVYEFAVQACLMRAGDVITTSDLESGIKQVSGLIRQTGDHGVNVSDAGRVEFTDVGGLDGVKDLIRESLFFGGKDGILGDGERCKGVLLYGPPGTGKTMLAKAVATECKANFLAVSVAGIVKGLIGESEKQIANLFAQAKATSPCIIFLDEIESVFASRESSGDFSQKILAQLVQEMDALGVSKENEDAPQVVVLAATNYPALMDATLLRPGRIDRLIAVRAPNLSQRASIFRVYASKTPCRDGIDWTEWARRVKGFTGAGISELFRKARLVALARSSGDETSAVLEESDFESALRDMTLSRDADK